MPKLYLGTFFDHRSLFALAAFLLYQFIKYIVNCLNRDGIRRQIDGRFSQAVKFGHQRVIGDGAGQRQSPVLDLLLTPGRNAVGQAINNQGGFARPRFSDFWPPQKPAGRPGLPEKRDR